MDDPLFDPWASEPDAPAPPQSPQAPVRWRALAGPPPSVPRSRLDRTPAAAGPVSATPMDAAPTPPRRPAGVVPRARLAGTPGFLRTMAVPRLHDVASRLQMARHTASVEDALDDVPPAVTLAVRPWSGPWTADDVPVDGMLELMVSPGAEGEVIARTWLGPRHDILDHEVSVAPAKLSAAWLEGRVFDFLARLLRR
ncbi:MAG: hypothetical protein ABL963_09685 [Longimicrobiales bacterium]